MARTTLNLDTPLLEEFHEMRKTERKSLGDLVSELIAEALALRVRRELKPQELHWKTREMGARVDISDKEALFAALDEGPD